MLKWIKRPRYFIPLIIVIVIIIFAVRAKGNSAPVYDFIVAERGDVTQEVSVTGRVRAAAFLGSPQKFSRDSRA